jgi:hypothetical protein
VLQQAKVIEALRAEIAEMKKPWSDSPKGTQTFDTLDPSLKICVAQIERIMSRFVITASWC